MDLNENERKKNRCHYLDNKKTQVQTENKYVTHLQSQVNMLLGDVRKKIQSSANGAKEGKNHLMNLKKLDEVNHICGMKNEKKLFPKNDLQELENYRNYLKWTKEREQFRKKRIDGFTMKIFEYGQQKEKEIRTLERAVKSMEGERNIRSNYFNGGIVSTDTKRVCFLPRFRQDNSYFKPVSQINLSKRRPLRKCFEQKKDSSSTFCPPWASPTLVNESPSISSFKFPTNVEMRMNVSPVLKQYSSPFCGYQQYQSQKTKRRMIKGEW